MPRETKASRAAELRKPNAVFSPAKSAMRQPLKIPLNDDREEKAVRFQSRQALHEMHLNSIRAAASPMRVRRSLGAQDQGSPHTPTNGQNKENDSDMLDVVSGNAVTPMKRVPILANFEEWMKMATDNKINAANSWNFALIDYFHDMSLLREGDSVNFQKASCTLDGCVKIYTSRVDSVATETGKLLSGLADSGNKNRRSDGEDGEAGGENDDGDGDGEDGEDGEKRSKKRKQRSSEATLASSFAQLQLKKMDLEFAVDPLFKKASADFDEGGAKGLLLNHLTVDSEGRIVFDSSDDAAETPQAGDQDDESTELDALNSQQETRDDDNQAIDVQGLGSKFFANLSILDNQQICPSLTSFELGGDASTMDIPFLKADDWKKDPSQDQMHVENPTSGFDDDDNDFGGGFDAMGDVGFGEGGEAWAREAAMDTQPRPHDAGDGEDGDEESNEVGGFDAEGKSYGVHLQHRSVSDDQNILSYFDQALSKNWAGPEHWRIRKIKDITKPQGPARQRKEKEPFQIDFSIPLTKVLADKIYTPAASNSSITLPKSQWRSKTRNLLPDDKHFNSKDLLSLFLKPKARIGARKSTGSRARPADQPTADAEMDGAFWARQHAESSSQGFEDDGVQGNYDANFFADDGLGASGPPDDDDGDEFADAQEHLPAAADAVDSIQPGELDPVNADSHGGYGSQLVTQSRRLRPEYVTYAKVAKKVDVRRLKEELWKNIGFESLSSPTPPSSGMEETDRENAEPAPAVEEKSDELKDGDGLKFTTVMNSLQAVYPKQAMADISTSYCFICLLHLANEKGLVLGNEPGFGEISIRKDFTAEITGPE